MSLDYPPEQQAFYDELHALVMRHREALRPEIEDDTEVREWMADRILIVLDWVDLNAETGDPNDEQLFLMRYPGARESEVKGMLFQVLHET